MIMCPYCERTDDQVKSGKNASQSQRYQCLVCRRCYTPAPGTRAYSDAIRRQAIDLHLAGVPFRKIGRQLGVNHQSVINWIRQYSDVQTGPDAEIRPSEEFPVSPMQRANIADVAVRAGVSVATVSNYLNQKGRMSVETSHRIGAAMDALHFTPSALARATRERRTRIIGVLIFKMMNLDAHPTSVDALTGPLLSGIYEAVDAANYDILIYSGWPDRPSLNAGTDFLNRQIDGLLWFVPQINAPALERVVAAKLPVVAALTRHVPKDVCTVNGDNIGGVEAIIAHLVEQGHRRIAFAGPVVSSNFEDRLEGYRRGLSKAGIAWDADLEATRMPRQHTKEIYWNVLNRWLALSKPPTAIVMVTDFLASWMAEMLQERGLRVPDDMALAGFDDVPAAQLVCGGLTTVHQPFQTMGRLATEKLIALIEGTPIEQRQEIVSLPLIIRSSTSRR